jgi:hypothetical protein
MCCRQAASDLDAMAHRLVHRNDATIHATTERLAFQQFRNDVGHVSRGSDIENGDDVRMIEGAGGPGFAVETDDEFRGDKRIPDYLDRYVAAKPKVTGAVEITHASAVEETQDLVGAEAIASRERDISLRESMPPASRVESFRRP